MSAQMPMTKITFKAKPETIFNVDDSFAYERIKVPVFTRSHCDMDSFKRHPKYAAYANSDLFPNILSRIRKEHLGDYINLNRPLPENVLLDRSGFLTVVTLNI